MPVPFATFSTTLHRYDSNTHISQPGALEYTALGLGFTANIPNDNNQSKLFVQLCSWIGNEHEVVTPSSEQHSEILSLIGKKVRIELYVEESDGIL